MPRPRMLSKLAMPGSILQLNMFVIIYWIYFFFSDRSLYRGPFAVVSAIVIPALAIVMLITARNTIAAIAMSLLYTLLSTVFVFATLYWGYGSSSNFSVPLTRLDSIYFAVGTLSTAGTGNIAAISELSRELQLAQMILDFMLVVFAIALITPRLVEHFKN